jgi:hypothetical protein
MAPGEIARREVEAGVAKVIRCATDRGILRSCTASLLVLWLLMLAAANTTRDRWTGMIVFTAAFAVLLKAAWAINAARAVRAGRREFEQRFPLGSAQRADAQRQLSEALGRFDPRTRAVLGRILASTGHRVRRG